MKLPFPRLIPAAAQGDSGSSPDRIDLALERRTRSGCARAPKATSGTTVRLISGARSIPNAITDPPLARPIVTTTAMAKRGTRLEQEHRPVEPGVSPSPAR